MTTRGWVWLNGRMQAAERARVSVFDRGLLYGDGVFETLRVYGGEVFALEMHLARLREGAERLALPLPALKWAVVLRRLLQRNGLAEGDGWVRVTLTRGPSERGLLPSEESRSTLLISSGHLDPRLELQQRRGIAVVVLPFGRNPALAEIKSANYLDGVLGRMTAARQRGADGLFVAADGSLTESTTANLFIVARDALITPPAVGILRGITRELVLKLARDAGWKVNEKKIRPAHLLAADEVFLTSSIAEIMPVVQVNGRRVGGGRPGPRTLEIRRMFRRLVGVAA